MVLDLLICILYSQDCSYRLSRCLLMHELTACAMHGQLMPCTWSPAPVSLMQTLPCRYLNPVSWGLYGIIVTQMGDLVEPLALTDGTSTTVKAYLYDTYHYDYSFRWPVSSPTCLLDTSGIPGYHAADADNAEQPCRHGLSMSKWPHT